MTIHKLETPKIEYQKYGNTPAATFAHEVEACEGSSHPFLRYRRRISSDSTTIATSVPFTEEMRVICEHSWRVIEAKCTNKAGISAGTDPIVKKFFEHLVNVDTKRICMKLLSPVSSQKGLNNERIDIPIDREALMSRALRHILASIRSIVQRPIVVSYEIFAF